MTDEQLTRQLDIIPLDVLNTKISIVGAGAIGSFTTLALSKMGFSNITIWDFDDVSTENMNCQWYRPKDIGKKKVLALAEIIEDFTGEKLTTWPYKYEGGQLQGIVISAVDSMAVRRMIWENIVNTFGAKYLIDPRMGAEYALMYVMNPSCPEDKLSYPKTVYTDEAAVQEPCTAKATMYTAAMIAGHVAKAVKDIVTGNTYARVTDWNIATNKQSTWSKKNENDQQARAT